MYDIKALELGIVKCKENIKVFENAIDKEHNTIREYRRLIQVLKEKEEQKELLHTLPDRIEIDGT